MVVVERRYRGAFRARASTKAESHVILLDTNALLWLETRHSRARPLAKVKGRLFISPASLLEIQFLAELGRVRLKGAARDLAYDDRWTVDEPPAAEWFDEAHGLSWTRDPFDRLIVAHANARRFRLATADANILEHFDRRRAIEL